MIGSLFKRRTSQATKKVILHLCADTGSDTMPYQKDPEYEVIDHGRVDSDMEFRSLCSQKYAEAFKQVNP